MKKLYLTVVSDTGNRKDARADMPSEPPNRADFDQYAVLQPESGRYEVHIYLTGMDYTEQETAGFVNALMAQPVARAGVLQKVVPLDSDADYPALLIVDEYAAPYYQVVRARQRGDDLEIVPPPFNVPKDSYDLALVLGVYEAAEFSTYQIPYAANPERMKSSAFVAVHQTVTADWRAVAGAFIEWIKSIDQSNSH